MSLTTAVWIVVIAVEAALVGLMLYRQIWRRLPLFFVYCIWSLLSDAGSFAISFSPARDFFAANSLQFYYVETVIDIALQFSVLIELAGALFRPTRISLRRNTLLAIVATIFVVGGSIWSFASSPGLTATPTSHIFVRLLQIVQALRILFFLALALSCYLFALRFTRRELQVARGFGFYSLISAAVGIVNSRPSTASHLENLCFGIAGSLLFPMMYWVFKFAVPDPPEPARSLTA